MSVSSRNQEPPEGKNRLFFEKSPYLLQHANNPVDWYPWGEEAFEKARLEDKPVFLSIGYSACHWCHVMAHESFENEDIAEILNKNYISNARLIIEKHMGGLIFKTLCKGPSVEINMP